MGSDLAEARAAIAMPHQLPDSDSPECWPAVADRTRRGHGAMFQQIASEIRDDLASGRLSPGDRVPSESELMARFGVARMTVRQGLAELRSEGLLVAEHGRGVFVRRSPGVVCVDAEALASLSAEDVSVRRIEGAPQPVWVVDEVSARMPTPDERRRLRIPEGTPVIVVRREGFGEVVVPASRYALRYRLPREGSADHG